MSDETPIEDDGYYEGGARRAKKKRGVSGCLAVLVALAVLVGGFYFAVTKGVDQLLGVDAYVPGCPPPPEALSAVLDRVAGRVS